MADLEKTIKIIFGGDDKLSPMMKNISSEWDTLDNMVGKVTQPLAKAADTILKVDAALAALAVGGLAYAYAKSVEFETAMVGLKKVTDGSIETLEAGRKAAFELSAEYGVSATKVLNSTTDFVQAGYNTQEAMMLTKAAMDLKIAGDIDAALSSEMLIATLKGFNAPASEATHVIDVLNEVSNKYATDVKELGTGMSVLAPIAKIMNLSFEETAGILTPVIEVFRSGNESAIALKTGLLKLIDDSKPVADGLASIGVAQRDANGQLRSGKDILFDVAERFKTLDQNQKLFVTQQLVGIEQAARMVTVFDNLSKVAEIVGVGMNSAGSAAKEVAARLESSQVQIDRFKVGFENLGITIGDKFRESTTKAIAGGNEVMAAFQGMVASGTFDPIFDALSGFSARLYEYLKVIAKNLPAAFEQVNFSGLLEALGDLGDAFGSWFDGLDLTTVDGLAEALQTVTDIITGLIRVTEGMVEGFKPFASAIADFLLAMGRGDEESQKTLGTILALAKAVEMAGLAFVAAIMAIDQYKINIAGVFNLVAGGAQILWNGLQLVADAIQGLFVILEGSLLNFIKISTLGLATLVPGFRDMVAVVEESGRKVGANIDQNGEDAKRGLDKMILGFNQLAEQAIAAKSPIENTGKSIAGLPSTKTMSLDISNMITEAGKAAIAMTAIPDTKAISVTVQVDEGQIEEAKGYIRKELPDGTVTYVQVYVDDPKLQAAKTSVDNALPGTKKVDVTLETAKLKEQSEIIQKQIEWKAKLDIAQVESQTKIVEGMFKSIDNSITSTGNLLSDMMGSFTSAKGLDKGFIEEQIKDEADRRDQSFALQKDLIQKQIEMMELKTEAMRRGESTITVQADGLKPHLEAILWEVLEACQVRANESEAEFLMGIS